VSLSPPKLKIKYLILKNKSCLENIMVRWRIQSHRQFKLSTLLGLRESNSKNIDEHFSMSVGSEL